MKNGRATGNDHINIETLKAEEECVKNAKMMISFKKGYKKDLNNYRPMCLLSNICKVFTKVLTERHSTNTSHESKLDSKAETQRPHQRRKPTEEVQIM